MLCDSHCHLESQQAPYPKDMLLITCGYSVESSLRNLEIAKGNQNVYCCVGIAPQEAQKFGSWAELEKAVAEIGGMLEAGRGKFRSGEAGAGYSKIVAVGEIGLDFHWAKSGQERGMQEKCFVRMLLIAEKYGMPVVIHCRKAEEEVLGMLSQSKVRFLMHCFSGNALQAGRAVELGGMISIPPLRSKGRKRVIKFVPMERIVAESDSPAIGKSPQAVRDAVAMVAEYRGIGIEEAEGGMLSNACKFFGIKEGGNHA